MQLTVVGLNHQTAPLSIREKLAFAAANLPDAVSNLARSEAAEEAVILSTCNRTELYCVGESEKIINWLAKYHNLPVEEIRPYLYTLDNNETVRHAFRVACGLDSMVLGEPQILGQIKDAVRVAQEQESINTHLNALFQKTFAVAKEVRTDTAVGENSVSMASASVKMAEQIFPSISDLNVLFIGAGEMIELVATYFAAKNPKLITVANRTHQRAQELCDKLSVNAEACLLNELPDILHDYDVVVSSTASQLPLVGKGMVERALKKRHNMPVFLLDLAVPRDIEAEVGELEDAYLYTVDDMMDIVQSGKDARKKAAAAAESMVEEKVSEFIRQQKNRQSVPLIRALRDEGERARRQVLENPKLITVANRTHQRAQELCDKLSVNAEACLLNELPDILHDYDVVVSSTASQLPLVGKGMVERALKKRHNMPVFLLDLAVPRDIEAEVGELEDAYLYTVDDMMDIVQSGKDARKKAAAAAESMVEEKVSEFIRQQKNRQSVPLIRALRDEGERARRQVLENAMKQLAKGVSAEDVLERLSIQLTNKLLHSPTRTLNKAGSDNSELIDAVAQIYHLDQHD